MSLRHEHRLGGNGGGGEDVNIFSSRHTITAEEVSEGNWDVNVAGEDSLRFLVHNFKELMEAFVTVGTMYTSGDKTSCVIQLMNDIDMTNPTEEDEDLYTVNGNKIIDRTNYVYNLRLYLRYTSIISDGAQRTLQLIYPENYTRLNTWTFKTEWFSLDNVNLGGSSSSWNTLNPDKQRIPAGLAVVFSRYLIASSGNVTYVLRNSSFPVCGANASSNGFNPFIYEGSSSNRPNVYNTRYEIVNCSFLTGADPSGGNIWSQTYAPIVINATYMENYQRIFRIESCLKAVGTSANDTGVPNIQIWSPSSQSNSPWQVTCDGTALVSHQWADSILLKTRLAVNDLYIQGQPTLQPEGATPTYNWVSLAEELQKRTPIEVNTTTDAIDGNEYFVFQDPSQLNTKDFKRESITLIQNWISKEIGRENFFIYDPNNQDSRMVLLGELSTTTNDSRRMIGLLWYSVGVTEGIVDGGFQRVYFSWNHGTYSIKTDIVSSSGNFKALKPCIVYVDNKYYFAIQQFGRTGSVNFLGQETFGLNAQNTLPALYYSSATEKWYTEKERTNEINVVFHAQPARFLADNLDFGGTSSQAVAGDGSFLNWDSKLGYWTGNAQEYADLPADQKDLPNVLYVIT